MTEWNEWDVRVAGVSNGTRMRVTGFTPNFPSGLRQAPGSVRLEFWAERMNHLDLTFDPEVMRDFAEDIIAMCDVAQGRT